MKLLKTNMRQVRHLKADETHVHHIGLHKVEWDIYNGKDAFMHRLRIGNVDGAWVGWGDIAVLNYAGKQFRAATEVWKDTFPSVFQVVPRLQ